MSMKIADKKLIDFLHRCGAFFCKHHGKKFFMVKRSGDTSVSFSIYTDGKYRRIFNTYMTVGRATCVFE